MKNLLKKYINDYFPSHENDWFDLVKSKGNLADQIEAAALTLNSAGLMHSHQRRVGLRRLKKYARNLLSEESIDRIRRAVRSGKFHNVYLVLKQETENHYMISGLTVYDVAQRICFAYGIEPEFVYLHTGTSVGARNLGVDVRRKDYLKMQEIPNWITSILGPADIENFLCIYKDDFLSNSRLSKTTYLPKRSGKIC